MVLNVTVLDGCTKIRRRRELDEMKRYIEILRKNRQGDEKDSIEAEHDVSLYYR
jgi:hypothetical protein